MEIILGFKHGSGSEKIDRKSMKVHIPDHITEDQDSFTPVRCFGKSPMIGYVDQGVFYLVWLDRKHICY
jgi:hypothetical protein